MTLSGLLNMFLQFRGIFIQFLNMNKISRLRLRRHIINKIILIRKFKMEFNTLMNVSIFFIIKTQMIITLIDINI